MFTTSSAGKKRSRVDDDETTLQSFSSPLEKRSRPTANASGAPSPWLHRYHDSVLSTPTLSRSSTLGIPRSPPKYDSEDDENSSEISEPGSPQDISMSSGDEGEALDDSTDHYSLHPPRQHDEATFSASPPDGLYQTSSNGAITRSDSPNPWPSSSSLPRTRQTTRVPTPIFPLRTKSTTASPNGVRAHVRQRHPQEISHAPSAQDPPTKSTSHLSVPSPILESADFPTPPPSAAEAAGSQLSQLSVSDVDMLDPGVPAIAIERVGSPEFAGRVHGLAVGGGEQGGIVVRRQRMRSGALNGGERTGGRGGEGLKGLDGEGGGGGAGQGGGKRGFSIGYRPDCEKCRERVPGHMNHFWG
ncbi:unnamed protein product [Zymoseptoria tritici ST99CH_1A5]|uniref:Uncharacterized protein n=2 Tax=Zymoseptoria tritici TaxID=1047171 RepID=A0A1X7RLR0_ZYMT9|nr:unnamed protein product [Zymoseptoria tritici ST99CH_3D7]SMR49349.1 unnamed protein product [Zymoseptoria tritici ST99CH_3D1]SMY22049.1 unnamed protein product [Zymoseptoria tritici ST99CH_1A5]